MSHSGIDLNEVSAELRALNLTYAVATHAPDGTILSANNAFLRLLGYTADELIGLDMRIFFSDSYVREQFFRKWQRVANGEAIQDISLYSTRDGVDLWLESNFVPIRDDNQKVTSIVQIAQDVTQREARTAEEGSQIRSIIAHQAVVHLAPDGEILWTNKLFRDALGYGANELIGRQHQSLLDEKDSKGSAYAGFWEKMRRGEYSSGEFRRIAKDGAEVWFQASYCPIHDKAGRLIKIIGYANDITSELRRKAEYQWQLTAIHKSNAVIEFDIYGTILEANDLFLQAVDYEIDEIRGRHHRIFVEPSHAHGVEYAAFWEDLRAGNPRVGQFCRIAKGGRQIWLQATYNPIFNTNGDVIKIVKFASVVTSERLLQAEHQGQIAAINNAQGVISFDIDGTVLEANEKFLDVMGYRYAEVRGRHHRMFCEPDHAESEEYQKLWQDLARGAHRTGEFKRLAKDGSEVWLQANYNPIRDMTGRIFKVVKYVTDVTADKLRKVDYQGQIEAINKSQDVAVFALDGTILDVNDNFLATTGYERDELIGRHHSVLVPREIRGSEEYAKAWSTLKSGQYLSGMFKRLGKDGREIWVQASYNPIFDLNGKPAKIVKYATDVSDNVALAEAFDEAKRLAQLDAGTSLPNRNKLASFMTNHLADSAGTMAVFYIDLDKFKSINDTHGHHIGDRVLGEVADRMRRALREDQIVARVGGDEFVIAAPGMTTEAVDGFCERLYSAIAKPIDHDDGEISINMSIGIAMAPTDGSTPDELLRAADTALYRSKTDGRGIYNFFSSDMNDRLNGQRKLIEEMRNSLVAGDFFLEYQPRFLTHDHAIGSLEALVRWSHPERGRVPPIEFIPLAEQCGLIITLGEWVLRTACTAAARWKGVGISVNVSPVQFRDPEFVQKVRNVLDETGLSPHLLELEITEGVLLEDADRAIVMLNEIKSFGIRLAMDDFGTGYSSLSYLRNFPFDVIKIDRSFVKDLDGTQGGRPIVQAIVGLGNALGLSVTAEGVETQEQLSVLTADRCKEVQGFLLAKPMDEQKTEQLLASHAAKAEEFKKGAKAA